MDDTSFMLRQRRVEMVSAGASHTVALLSGDIVCSWGQGEDGQLGHGDADERHSPTIISSLEECEICSITCGADHTIARSDSRAIVYSWGWGDFGRLGHGNSSDLFIPHPIKGLQGIEIKQIVCGDSHCLAVTRDGEVKSWGRNQNGQLGLGHSKDCLTPCTIQAFEISHYKRIISSLKNEVTASCMSHPFFYVGFIFLAFGLPATLGICVKMIAAGAEHTAAVTQSGKLYGWGWGQYGNLGVGDRNDRLVPAEVASVPGKQMNLVACGWRHTIAVSDSGILYTYGWSKYGQLGHGDYEDHLVPHQVAALKGNHIVQISGGWRHTMALDDQGKLYGWGWNKFGQVGVGNNNDHNSPQFVKMPAEECVKYVSCGWRHTVAMSANFNVYSWGRGTSGQLGHGDALDRNLPKMMDSLSADGEACTGVVTSMPLTNAAGAIWISPSERYAVVPDETERTLASRPHETASVDIQLPRSLEVTREDSSVPDTDFKRIRTE